MRLDQSLSGHGAIELSRTHREDMGQLTRISEERTASDGRASKEECFPLTEKQGDHLLVVVLKKGGAHATW